MTNNITAIVDYGVGNLFSLSSSLKAVGANAVITNKKEVIKNAARVILPGVGAFADAYAKLCVDGLDETVKCCASEGKPILGICLGMQLLFDNSLEYGNHKGLGLIPGSVVPLRNKIRSELKVPHIGWNKLVMKENEPVYKYVSDGAFAYYVHSYYAETDEKYIIAYSEYDIKVTGAVRNANVLGMQYHPEKSGDKGLLMLKAFCEEACVV